MDDDAYFIIVFVIRVLKNIYIYEKRGDIRDDVKVYGMRRMKKSITAAACYRVETAHRYTVTLRARTTSISILILDTYSFFFSFFSFFTPPPAPPPPPARTSKVRSVPYVPTARYRTRLRRMET